MSIMDMTIQQVENVGQIHHGSLRSCDVAHLQDQWQEAHQPGATKAPVSATSRTLETALVDFSAKRLQPLHCGSAGLATDVVCCSAKS